MARPPLRLPMAGEETHVHRGPRTAAKGHLGKQVLPGDPRGETGCPECRRHPRQRHRVSP